MLNFKPERASEWEYAFDILGEWTVANDVGRGTTNMWQRGIRSGFSATRPGMNLTVNVVDAGMLCPIVEHVGLLGNATPMGEGNPSLPDGPSKVNISGVSASLVQNLMPISGFPQWYPFGVGSDYQAEDENSIFRFELLFSTN